MQALKSLLEKEIVVMDCAMGTTIQLRKLEEADFRGTHFKDHPSDLKGNNDILCLTQPQVIQEIHLQNLQSGARILSTNTFNGTRLGQLEYGLEEYVTEINKSAAELARKAIQEFTGNESPPRGGVLGQEYFIAGAMGPTNKTLSISPDVEDPGKRGIYFDELYDQYREQALGLLEGGIDIFLVETIFDSLNARACFACHS